MGWASGGRLADNLYDILIEYIPYGKRMEVAEKIIAAFDDMDCDVETKWDRVVWKWNDEKDSLVHKETGETYREYHIRKREEKYE
jgi:hypothetical protein